MNILYLTPYPFGKAPSQRFRFEFFLPLLQQKKISFDQQAFISEKGWNILYDQKKTVQKLSIVFIGFIRRFIILFKLNPYDFIFIHRELTPFGPPIFEWIIAKAFRKKIIYDFDDAIWLPDQNKENPIWKWLKWRNKVASICKWSYKVSTGNEYLASYAAGNNTNVVIFPTVVDTEVHKPSRENRSKKKGERTPIIGWTGSHSTLFYLNQVLSVLQDMEKEIDFEFRVIANRDPQLPLKNFRFIPWNKDTEIEDLNAFDIGIMPLPDDEWSKGKCGFKLIQYLAVGIPAIASPVGVNTQIIQEGKTGFIATSSQEWKKCLLKLLKDPSLRTELGRNGRMFIEKNYSVMSQKKAFTELFRINGS